MKGGNLIGINGGDGRYIIHEYRVVARCRQEGRPGLILIGPSLDARHVNLNAEYRLGAVDVEVVTVGGGGGADQKSPYNLSAPIG